MIFCPDCSKTFKVEVESLDEAIFDCPHCGTRFVTKAGEIVQKRSEYNAGRDQRATELLYRVGSGPIESVKYASTGRKNEDFRSGEEAIFFFIGGRLAAVIDDDGEFVIIKSSNGGGGCAAGCAVALACGFFLLVLKVIS